MGGKGGGEGLEKYLDFSAGVVFENYYFILKNYGYRE
jgi:hypothetical protein